MSGISTPLAALLAATNLLCALSVAAQRPGATKKPRTVEPEGRAPRVTRQAQIPTPAATLPASARYRVTLAGFHVNRESWDTFLETDGKGDEIAISAEVVTMGADGKPIGEPRWVKSVVYGDRNNFPAREQAGSRSRMGGLKTGDNVPAVPDPWVARDKASGHRLPLLLWEGELRLDENALVVAPTVWELDSDDVLTAAPANTVLGVTQVLRAVTPIASTIPGTSALMPAVTSATELASQAATFQKDAMNRPIGLMRGGAYSPKLVVLNVRTAEASLASRAGKAPGVIEVRYADPEELKGDYTLFLLVERLP